VQNEISMKVLDEKLGYVASVAPEIIATANVGCMLQFRVGVQRRKMTARVAHVVELLDQVYRSPQQSPPLTSPTQSGRTGSSCHSDPDVAPLPRPG
jgi:hypothetical protein